MARKFGLLVVMLTLAVSASAGVNPGSISGFVKNSAGVPQMGAAVEVLTSLALQPQTFYTDARGFYTLVGLNPGTYNIKVSAPSFLPALKERIAVPAGASVVINVTLNTLFEAIQLVPRRGNTVEDQEDWKWTLRSMSNRPILRLQDEGPLVVVSDAFNENDKVLKASVSFIAGSNGQGFGGSSDMSTAFKLEQSVFSSGKISLDGDVGYGSSAPAGAVRATYSMNMPDGTKPEISLTARRFASPELALHNSALQALAITLSNTETIGDALELNYGGEMQSVQFMVRVNAFRPFGSADLHISRNTVLEYRYASSVPNMRHAKGFDSAPADLSESGPRVSMIGYAPQIERARHNEVSISQRLGKKNNVQAAWYTDRASNYAIVGLGEDGVVNGDVLPDVYSGTFNYNGGEIQTSGMRLVYQRKIANDLTATLDYAFGGVLTLDRAGHQWNEVRDSLRKEQRHAVAGKIAGTVPSAKTKWIASYRWMNGDGLTPVDMFNTSAGQADPFFNLFLRQPIPAKKFIPQGVEALVDVRNLLAQGYMPVIGSDGRTVYLVQAARSIRGGVMFTF